jgi:hypothetical protein
VYGSNLSVGKKKSLHRNTNWSCNCCQGNSVWDKLSAVWHMELVWWMQAM